MNKVAKNFFLNSLYQVLTLLVPLITVPYISRIFVPEQIGIYSFTFSLANYFVLFSLMGLSNLGSRVIAKSNDSETINNNFSYLFSMQIITSLVSLLVYLGIVTFFMDKSIRIYGYIQVLYLLSAALDITWLFYGLEKFRITVLRNVIVKLGSTIMIFLFVKNSSDLVLYTCILSTSFFVSSIVLWPNISFVIEKKKIFFGISSYLLKQNFILFIPVAAVSVYRVMSKVILGSIGSLYDVGIYENANKLVSVPLGIISALGVVMIPHVSSLISQKRYDEINTILNDSIPFITFIATALSVGIIAINADFVPVFFGMKFLETENIIYVLAPSIFFIAIANVVRTQLLIPMERDRDYVRAVIYGAIVNLLLNFLLIPKFGAVGSAIATLVAEIVVCLRQLVVVRKEVDIFLLVKNISHYLLISIPMVFLIKVISSIEINSILKIFLQIVFGGGLFIILTVLFKKDTFKVFKKEIIK